MLYSKITMDERNHDLWMKEDQQYAIILMYYLIRSVTSLGVANWHSPELMIWWLFLFTIREDQGIHRLYRNENIRLMEERSNWMRRDMGLTTGLRGGVEENG